MKGLNKFEIENLSPDLPRERKELIQESEQFKEAFKELKENFFIGEISEEEIREGAEYEKTESEKGEEILPLAQTFLERINELKKEREDYREKYFRELNKAVSSLESKLENAFKRIGNLTKDSESLENVFDLYRLIKQKKRASRKNPKLISEINVLRNIYQEKIEILRNKLIEELFNPRRNFQPYQIEPWKRDSMVQKVEVHSKRNFYDDLSFLKDPRSRSILNSLYYEGKKEARTTKKRVIRVLGGYWILRQICGLPYQKNSLDRIFSQGIRNKTLKIIKKGGFPVKIEKKGEIEWGAVKLNLRDRGDNVLIRVEEVSDNLKKTLRKGTVYQWKKNEDFSALPEVLREVLTKFKKTLL